MVRISEGVFKTLVQLLVTDAEEFALFLLPINDLASNCFDVSAEG